MRDRSVQRTQGFTLIELLIATGILLVVLLGIYNMFDTNRQTYVSGTRKVDVQQNARVALDQIAREIRMAGYFPENFPNSTLTNPQAIQIAQNNGLAILGDADGSGVSKLFLYCLYKNNTTQKYNIIRKWTAVAFVGGVFNPVPPAAAYTCSVENVPNVRVGDILAEVAPVSSSDPSLSLLNYLKFTYYYFDSVTTPTPIPNPPTVPYTLDTEGLGNVPPFASTAQRGTVRTVVVTLTAKESVPGPGEQPQIYTLTSSVRLRNLGN